MKIKLLSFIFTAFILSSCVSTKVSSKNNFDFSVLKANSNYIIETKEGNKIREFEFLRSNETMLIGKQEGKDLQIEKNNVNRILKHSAGKTIPLVVGIIGAAILVPAYVKNEPVGK
ncbi:hypothetical protein [Chryseobacterium sp.]|uniref:hypothetical protein n=1 Tax=Chryseobacterium sp. TaxID=1871047 RepID=UPI00388ED7EB